MHGTSTTIDKSTKSYQWVAGQPDYTHKCVGVKPVFQLPFNPDKYPSTFMKLYTHINSQLEAKAAKFRKEATELIHKGHGIMCLQYKLDRIHIMFTHLITRLDSITRPTTEPETPTKTHGTTPIRCHPTSTSRSPESTHSSTPSTWKYWNILTLTETNYMTSSRSDFNPLPLQISNTAPTYGHHPMSPTPY
jgi:hypothetical protein